MNSVSPEEVRFYLNIFMRFSLQTAAKELSEFYFKGVHSTVQVRLSTSLIVFRFELWVRSERAAEQSVGRVMTTPLIMN